MPKDYYLVLGISRGADLQKIKKAYRQIIKQNHPDVSASPPDMERYHEAQEAYETLVDAEKRRAYDRELSRQDSSPGITRMPESVRERTVRFEEMDRHFSFVDEFFEGFLPGLFDRGREREKELYYEAVLSPEEAARGGLFPVSVSVVEPCPRCSRRGVWESFFCPECGGEGRVRTRREFSLSIPPNVTDGTSIRLSMEDVGLKGTVLHVVVQVDPALEGGW